MQNRKPLLGMLTYTYHSVGESVIFDLLLCLGLGIGSLILGIETAIQTVVILTAGSAPYIILTKSGGIAKWEQYQLTMPIKRTHLAMILYLNVFIAALLMIPIIGTIWGIGLIFNQITCDTIIQGIPGLSFIYGIVLLLTALLYPLGCTKIGSRNEELLFWVCIIMAFAIVYAISAAGHAMGLTGGVRSLLIIAITGIAFIVSMFIVSNVYAKIDF